MPIYVFMNMVNIHFQPDEVLYQIESVGNSFDPVFLTGRLLSLFAAVFVAAGISFVIRASKTPWTFRIMAGLTSILAVFESFMQSYPFWYAILAVICCLISVTLSKAFVYKF